MNDFSKPASIQRDELAVLIAKHHDHFFGVDYAEPATQDFGLADELLASGWTKPRTITTMTELQKLGNGAVILDVDGDVSQRRAGQWCGYETAPLSDRKVSMFLPATVLWEPAS